MRSVSLGAYTIRVGPTRKTEKLDVSNFGDHDLHKVMKAYLKSRSSARVKDDVSEESFHVDTVKTSGRTLAGLISKGEYGVRSPIHDVDGELGDKSVVFNKTERHAEMIKYYYRFLIPHDSDEGIALFQRFGVGGIKDRVVKDFKQYFQDNHPEYRVDFFPLAPKQIFQQFFDTDTRAGLRKIELTLFGLPDDIAATFKGMDHVEKHVEVQLVVRAKRGMYIPGMDNRVGEVLDGKRHPNQLVEVKGAGAKRTRITFKARGRMRTLDLTDQESLRGYFDITDDVKFDGGLPTFVSINEAGRELMETLAEMMWGPDLAKIRLG